MFKKAPKCAYLHNIWMVLIVEEDMSCHKDKIFPTLLKTLSDSNDEVVILALRVLSVICKPGQDKHFSQFMVSILNKELLNLRLRLQIQISKKYAL